MSEEERRAELMQELGDLVYVCFQFADAFNIDLQAAIERVQSREELRNQLLRRELFVIC